jgi:hypothetical protein
MISSFLIIFLINHGARKKINLTNETAEYVSRAYITIAIMILTSKTFALLPFDDRFIGLIATHFHTSKVLFWIFWA